MGEVVGQYELREVLGGGGMATVYRGEHVSGIGMSAAVKKLHPHLAIDAKLRARLKVEAQALARLQHPNIVRLLDFVEQGDLCALVVELVEGRTLRAVMNAYEDPMPVSHAVMLFRQMVVAVGHAHAQGCLHRDIKPGNIMVGDGSAVKVLDFGIASLLDQERLTQTGISIGTPVYMAPEAISEGMEVLDARADVYALGVTFWEMLAGKGARPIGKRGWRLNPARVDQLVYVGVPEGITDLVKQMIADDADLRLASCDAVLRGLDRALEAAENTQRMSHPRNEDDERTLPLTRPPNASSRPAVLRAPPPPPAMNTGDLPTRRLDRPAPVARELTRPEPPRESTKRRRKKKKKRRSVTPLVVGAAALALASILLLVQVILSGGKLDATRGGAATTSVLQKVSGMVVFDRASFSYGSQDRRVVLSAFALDRTEVSVEDYGRCVAAGACPDRVAEYVGAKPRGAAPMEHVDWMQAQTYCEWRHRNATVPEGYGARLPTDAEWERAARGTKNPGRAFPLGDRLPAELSSAGTAAAPPVGSTELDRTPEGVADLTASVSEWVYDRGPDGVDEEDVSPTSPSNAASDPVAPPSARTKGTRAVRGSGYLQHPSMDHYFRSTARVYTTGTRSGPGRGFRCAVGPMP